MKEGGAFKKFEEIVNIKTGKLDANAMKEDGVYPFFTCSREIFKIDNYAFDCEAVLLAGNNASGDFNVKYYKGKFNAYQRTYVLTSKTNDTNLKFVKYKLEGFLTDLKNMSVGANTRFLKLGMIKSISIYYPTLTEQEAIVAKLDEAFAAIDRVKANLERNIDNAKELFQTKLNQVFFQKGDDWEEKKLGEVCKNILAGGDAPKNNLSNNRTDEYNIPIYANAFKDNGLYGYTNEAKVFEKSLTIAARGSGTGFTCIRLEPYVPIVRLLVLIPNDLITVEFLKLAVDSLVVKSNGSAIPQLTVPMLKLYSVYVPLVSEQKEIVHQLDQLAAQTRQLEAYYQQKLDNLEELRKSILEKAFKGELL